MVMMMHFAATVLIENHGTEEARKAIGGGQHLSTLAFSESGSRSHFWAPQGTATVSEGSVHLDAHKSWVTSAGEADSYAAALPAFEDQPVLTGGDRGAQAQVPQAG